MELTAVLKQLRIKAVVLLMSFALLTSCRPTVTIKNESDLLLRNLTVTGTGFNENVGALPPASQKIFYVRPSGESGIALAFDTQSGHHQASENGYFENSGFYHLEIKVDRELRVFVE